MTESRRIAEGRPWILEETNLRRVTDVDWEVAVLPWAATEAHNYHLPYGTDTVETRRIAAECGRLAWERGARVVVLPTIPVGVNVQQLDIPLTLNLNPSTQAAVLEDLVESLEGHGVAKLVVLNGHGGNDFRQMIREAQGHTTVFLSCVDWFRVLPAGDFFGNPGDHAGEMETSLMMHLAPELVRPLEEAGPGEERVFKIRALREGWAWAPRDWTRATRDTGVGDPSGSTAAAGATWFAALTERIAEYLVELADADPGDLYDQPEG
jgi:creatinine amidohydrolase